MRVERSAYGDPRWSTSLVRWGAVFAGTVVALALATMVSLLWLALAYSSHRRVFYQHLDWWIAGTAIGAIFLAGLIAGASSGSRGAAAGLANGITTWALVVLGLVAVGVPGLLASGNTVSLHLGAQTIRVTTANWWPAFWSVVIGFGAGAIGGLLGGSMFRRSLPVAGVEPATAAPAAPVNGSGYEGAAVGPAGEGTVRQDAALRHGPRRDEPVGDDTVGDDTVGDDTVGDEPVRNETVRSETVRDNPVRDEPVR
jgi:hypothetical protein